MDDKARQVVEETVRKRINEVDLTISRVDYLDMLVKPVSKGLAVVAYLSHDEDCGNPLEDMDGYGKILDRRDHSCTTDEFMYAVGRTRYGEPDVEEVVVLYERFRDIVADGGEGGEYPDFRERLDFIRETWVDSAIEDPDFQKDFARGKLRYQQGDETIFEAAEACFGGDRSNPFCDFDYPFMGDVLETVWKKFASDGLIGERYYVPLDVYSHSGEIWSITGEGMNCGWDTSRFAGLWIPGSKDMEQEVERRIEMFSYARIGLSRDGKRSHVRYLDGVDGIDRDFDTPWGAFSHLCSDMDRLRFSGYVPIPEVLAEARKSACEALAREALEVYNDWLSGRCYGCVFALLEIDGEDIAEIDNDHVWGFIGENGAMDNLEEELESRTEELVERLLKEDSGKGPLVVGDDGMISFVQKVGSAEGLVDVTWMQTKDGWKAFGPASKDPVAETGTIAVPSAEDLAQVRYEALKGR